MTDYVQQCVETEKTDADLAYKLVAQEQGYSNGIRTSGSTDTDYQDLSNLGVKEFNQVKHTPIPPELTEQLHRMQSNCAFGIFPEISRSWIAVDSDLFLWNFELNKDLAFYDSIENTILKVGLTNLAPGIFPTPHTKALVVATTGDLYILGLGFQDDLNQRRIYDQIDIRNPNIYLILEEIYKIPLDGIVVKDLISTRDGRIFFSSENEIYECQYYKDRWFGLTVKKIHQTKSYIPNVLSFFQTKEEIRQLAVDNTRHILYSLTDQSRINVFDLGPFGGDFKQAASTSLAQIVKESAYALSCDSAFVKELVSISVIPTTRSFYVYLEAVTTFGIRLFFTCTDSLLSESGSNRFAQERVRPTKIEPIHIRFPTGNPSALLQQQQQVYNGVTDKDTTILALNSAAGTNLYAFSSANFPFAKGLVESFVKIPTDAVVWAIASSAERLNLEQGEQIDFALDTMTMKEIELVPSLQPSLFSQQHAFPTEKLYVVTPEGISTIAHSSPVELFRQILDRYGTESKQLYDWHKIHGAVEVCIHALVVICSDKHGDLAIRDQAIRTFFSLGGSPEFVAIPQNPYSTQQPPFSAQQHLSPQRHSPFAPQQDRLPLLSPRQNPLLAHQNQYSFHQDEQSIQNQTFNESFAPLHASTPYRGKHPSQDSQMTLKFSNRHEALYTYFTRIIYYVWGRNVVFYKKDQFVSGLNLEDLRVVNKHLTYLYQAINQFALTGSAKFSTQIDGEANEKEFKSLENLRNLIDLTREFLNLWILLLEHDFKQVFSGLPSDIKDSLLKFTFADLLKIAPEKIGVEIITALIKFYLADEATTATLNNRLSEGCPKLFTNEDANVLKGIELLFNARSVPSVSQREESIRRAMDLLSRHADRVDMHQAAQLLKDLNYFVGIIDLAIAKAKRVDPRDYAKTAYRRNIQELGEMQEAVERRTVVYNIVVDTLNLLDNYANAPQNQQTPLSKAAALVERDQIIDRIAHSNDEMCQVVLFRWLIEHGLEEKVLSNTNPTLEHFIYTEIENDGATIYFDMLWRYYKGTEEYAKAAKLLYDLATKKAKSTTVEKKLEFLSQALICINCAPESQPNVQLKAKIRDWLDVARVQQQATKQLVAQAGRRLDPDTVRNKVDELNSNLLPASELFELAQKFDLPMLQLSVLHCVGHFDEDIVEGIYKRIIHDELKPAESINHDAFLAGRTLATRLAQLRKQYAAAPKFFPTAKIVHEVLRFALENMASKWLADFIKQSEIPITDLIDVCTYEYRVGDPFWKKNARARKFMTELAINLSEDLIRQNVQIAAENRRLLKTKCLEFIATLYVDVKGNEPCDQLETVQTLLDQLQ